jgi:hypothetical protein
MSALSPNVPNGIEDRKDHTPVEALSKLSLSSQAIHADDSLNKIQDVAPPLHLSTNFRYARNADALVPASKVDVRLN